jgi:hypothetical protein
LGRLDNHSFYPAAFYEKGVISNQPTKKFCEIAVVAVSPSYCLELTRVLAAGVVAQNPAGKSL